MRALLTTRLAAATEKRLQLLMYREDIIRHINKLQADLQITDREVLAADGAATELSALLAHKED